MWQGDVCYLYRFRNLFNSVPEKFLGAYIISVAKCIIKIVKKTMIWLFAD